MSQSREIASFYGQGKEVKNGAGWLTLCPVHANEKTPALAVTDNSTGDVDVYCHAGCNWKEIKDRFRADGVLPEWVPEKRNGTKTTSHTPPPQETKEEKESFVWTKASVDHDDYIKKYLAGRAINLDTLPICLRWNSYKDKITGDTNHMVVAAASQPSDTAVYAVQRLFIDIDDFTKAGAKMLGNCDGRGIWFDSKGDKTEIVIGEGIETVISAIQATRKNGVAALSTAGMKNLILPEETTTIYICADSDPVREKEQASMPGQKAAYVLAERFEAEKQGGKAYIVSPDDSCFTTAPLKLDFNDLLKEDPSGETIRARFEKAISFKDMTWKPAEEVAGEETTESKENDLSAEAAMFNRFVFLASENKIIDTVGHDIKDSVMIERAFTLSQSGPMHYYKDENGKDKAIPLSQHWLFSDNKKVASSLRYAPGKPIFFDNGDGRSYYNTFRFPYQLSEPIPTDEQNERLGLWHKIMDRVFHEHRSYIEDWFAYSIQYPEKRTGIMPVCISDVGLGKSLIMAAISRVIGRQNFSNAKILDVTGLGKSGVQWGDWIYNKKISCIEEIDPEGDNGISYKILDALKDIITNETLSLNLKGGRNGTFQVFSNIIGFSNHKNCVKIPFGDRRLYIIDSTGQKNLSKEEYGALWDWVTVERNSEAVYQYLLNREISDEFQPGQAKMTDEKKSMQADGRSVMQMAFDLMIEQFPCDLMTNGEIQLAVAQALAHIEPDNDDYGQRNWNADKQFQYILKNSTALVAKGKRIRVRREGGERLQPSMIRAIRNSQDWNSSTSDEIRAAMSVVIPNKWITEKEDGPEDFILF